MNIELKNYYYTPTLKEKIWRPLAATIVAGTALVGSGDKGAETKTSRQAAPSSVLVLENIDSLHPNFNIIPNQVVQGPMEPKFDLELGKAYEMQAGKEFHVGFTNAIEAKLDEERKAREEEARIEAEKIKEANIVQIQSIQSTSQGPTAASENGSSTKLITGYYCVYDSGYYGDGGGFCGHMANGTDVHDGAAACGPSYPLGTVFAIGGYGQVVCEDRGGAIGDDHIDVFTYYSSGLEAIPDGNRNVTQIR